MFSNVKDLIAGALCILIGGFFALQSIYILPIGTAARMGPGYFPLLVGTLLVGFGLIMLWKAVVARVPSSFGQVPVRGIIFLAAAPSIFGAAVRPLGFIPAVALTALISALASPELKFRAVLLLTVGLTCFAVLVFSTALGLNLPLFGPWASRFW